MRTPPNDTALVPTEADGDADAGNTRRCILSGARADPADLIRLALSPDGAVAPDVRARAPGRGAWIGVDRADIDAALAKGKLKGALARAFKGPVTAPPDLGGRIEAALARDALDRMGLEARAGRLIIGSERIETAARKGQVALLFHAADASADGRRKLDQAWRVGSDREGSGLEGMTLPCDRTILSAALGRENAVHVASTDPLAAERLRTAILRWLRFVGNTANGRPCTGEAQGPSRAVATVSDELKGLRSIDE